MWSQGLTLNSGGRSPFSHSKKNPLPDGVVNYSCFIPGGNGKMSFKFCKYGNLGDFVLEGKVSLGQENIIQWNACMKQFFAPC